MTLGQAYLSGKGSLEAAGIEDAPLDAFYLLQHVTGYSKAEYLLKKEEPLAETAFEDYRALIRRRAQHEPCQYLIGTTEFMGLTLKVTPAVLIPRQDTELLAELSVENCRKLLQEKRSGGSAPEIRVLDLCTGSGALAVSLKHFCPEASVTAVDISPEALAVAEENAKSSRTEICFLESDMFTALKERQFDLILSNPPYVTEEEYEALMPEVKVFEPKGALTAGEDGLDCYRVIAKEAGRYLLSGGRLLLEIGWKQAEAVTALLEENGFQEIETKKDLSGNDRVICCRKA